MHDRSWLELTDVARRNYDRTIWLPLYRSISTDTGEFQQVGSTHEYEGVRSIAIPIEFRTEVDRTPFQDLPVEFGPNAWNESYLETGLYELKDAIIGTSLCLHQRAFSGAPQIVHLHQDLIFGLNLIREKDSWIRPDEDFVEVARLEKNEDGETTAVLIKPEYLKDYLSARGFGLVISTYNERRLVVEDVAPFGFDPARDFETRHGTVDNCTIEVRSSAINEGSFGALGGETAVFHLGRSDEFNDDEIPYLEEPSESNTISEHRVIKHGGRKVFSLSGEARAHYWVGPSAQSPRVKGEKTASRASFIVGSSGERQSADELYDEEIGKWLWFSPQIVLEYIKRRGGSLEWYSKNTGGLTSVSSHAIHFGLNEVDLIVVYAYDIARLVEWERVLWARYNLPPAGGLGSELHSSQVRAKPEETYSPEAHLTKAMSLISDEICRIWKVRLFSDHQSVAEIIKACHRFRAFDEAGLLSLAKDLARVLVDNIDLTELYKVAPPVNGQGKGSIKTLERLIASVLPAERARKMTGPLVGIYDLRLGDAHLPSSKIEEAFELAEVDRSLSFIRQGQALIYSAVSVLCTIAVALHETAQQNPTAAPQSI